MVELELICSNCKKVLVMRVTPQEYNHYIQCQSFIEDSEAFKEFFWSQGWVLKQAIFCDTCKYDHSECYKD